MQCPLSAVRRLPSAHTTHFAHKGGNCRSSSRCCRAASSARATGLAPSGAPISSFFAPRHPGGTCNRTVGTQAVATCIQANQAVATCIQAPGGGKLAPDQAEFIAAARAKGRKLMVMTFSSMPVGRGTCNCSVST